MVIEVEFDEDNQVILCTIEAVITGRSFSSNWHDLKEGHCWIYGWK